MWLCVALLGVIPAGRKSLEPCLWGWHRSGMQQGCAQGLFPAGVLVVAGSIQDAPHGPCWPLKPVNKPQLQVIKEAFAG